MHNRILKLTVALLAIAVCAPVRAGDLVLVKKLDRKFPVGFCPFETRTVGGKSYGLFFTPGGTTAHITISVNNFDSQGNWYAYRLDNVAVVQRDAFVSHSGVTPGYDICYQDSENAPSLFFDNANLSTAELPFLETFDTSAGAFDLSSGAYFMPVDSLRGCFGNPAPSSAPIPSTGAQAGGGSLALGTLADGPIIRSTSFDVTGLLPGHEYLVSAWWWACTAETLRSLEVTVEGQLPTGVPGKTLIALDDVAHTSGVDRLLRIPDPTTGVAQLVGSLGSPFHDCGALAVQPVIGSPDRVFAVDNDRLLRVDPATGAGTLLGPIGYSGVQGLAFHPQTGTLYGVTYGSNKILRIDPTTGHGTVVASDVISGHRLRDLAFHPDGRAFILTGGTPRLYQVNILTGAKIRRWDLTGGASLEALTWSPDGTKLYTAADRGSTKDLATIDLTNGSLTFVGPSPSGFEEIEALAWVNSATAALLARWGAPTDVAPVTHAARLLQNVPNPFNPTTRIEFELARPEHVELSVHDVTGRLVQRLFTGELPAGPHAEIWNGRSADGKTVAAGLYYCTLRWSAGRETKPMVLVK